MLKRSVYAANMDAVRESWTDECLGEFSKRIDERFDRVDERFEAVVRRFDEVDKRFDRLETKMETGFAILEDRFDRLQQTIIQVGGGLIGVMIVGILTLVGTQI
jgi:DNA anti-recombination protein RmuC